MRLVASRAVRRRVRHRGHHRRAGERARPGRGLAGRLGPGTGPRSAALYYLRVFGEPGGAAPWGWRFGGHHVSLNNLVVDGVVARDDAVLPRRRPGVRRRCSAARRCARWPGPRTWPASWSARWTRTRPPGRCCWTGRRRTSSAATGPQLSDGDQVIHLREIWRGQFADPGLLDLVTRMGDGAEQASGYDDADHQRARADQRPEGPAGRRARRRAAGPAARTAGHLPRPGPGRAGPRPLRRRRRAGRRAPRLGRAHRPGRTALLPAAGPAAADRVRQHPAAAPTTPTRCGATRRPTSASTCSARTWPRITCARA